MTVGDAAQAVRLQGETAHLAAEEPEKTRIEIEIAVKTEWNYCGLEPCEESAELATDILADYQTTRQDSDPNYVLGETENQDRLNWLVEQGVERRDREYAQDETEVVQASLEQSETVETTAIEADRAAEAAETARVEATATSYQKAVNELAGRPNNEKIQVLLNDARVPEAYKEQLRAFNQIITIADQVPEDAPLIRQRINQLDMSQGVPDPVQFIQSAIFSSTDYDSGVSEATQNAIAAEFGITPTRPARPRNATEMQTTLREGRGTQEITEIQEVEEPPGSGIYVEREVVVGEEPIPFEEGDPLVLSASNPRVVAYPDPPGSQDFRFVGQVDGSDPVSMRRNIPADGAFPAEDINNDVNEVLVDAVYRNHGLAGGVQGLLGLSDGI